MYRAPVAEIAHTLKHVTGLGHAMEAGETGDLSADLLDAVLKEGGRFATEEVAPLNGIGDKEGAIAKDGVVTTATGWPKLYKDWAEGGWNALSAPEEFGGQGLPMSLQTAAFEMWNSGSLGFAIGPTLTIGAIEALNAHADDWMKQAYLPKLVSGEWTGTMNLTEPQSGSDLNGLKTRAEPADQDEAGRQRYRIFGQKIYITYGEHDLTDNIIHLVLARLPGAPEGQRGISLFLVPKVLVNEDGSLGARNDVYCNAVEHKLGIHASPTCTMIYGDGKFGDEPGALGYLIGEENRGLAHMFTMMNNARLLVGIQGVAVAEAATQKALAYAQERRQGRTRSYDDEGMAPIVHHPDVQRNLLTMRALTNAARAIAYNCAHAIDRAETLAHASARGTASGAANKNVSSAEGAQSASARAAILTPIAKAFSTDIGCDVASIGVQVHGGMGYVEETGAAQFMRDARIAPIYEGTNGIQAIDLVTRKITLGDGEEVGRLFDELEAIGDAARGSNSPQLAGIEASLDSALIDLRETTAFLLDKLRAGEKSTALAGATPYLRLFGLVSGGHWLVQSALTSTQADGTQRSTIARFFAHNLMAETASLRCTIEQGADSLLTAGAELLEA
ncbi:MAG: acyl-CoA dehydrogenase [Pseudomonadota bacterium]